MDNIIRLIDYKIFKEGCGTSSIIQIGSNCGNLDGDSVWKLATGNQDIFKAYLIEPIGCLFSELVNNYTDFKYVTCCNIAITCDESQTKIPIYYISEEHIKEYNCPWYTKGLGSTNPKHIFHLSENSRFTYDKILRDVPISKACVDAVTLNSFVLKHNITDIGFLQIDTEGYDADILLSYDFCVKPQVIQFEYVHIEEAWKGRNSSKLCVVIELLSKHNYQMIYQDMFNMVWLLKS